MGLGPKMASTWDFFGMGIFNFWVDRKIPSGKSRDRDRDLRILGENHENPNFHGISRQNEKSEKSGIFTGNFPTFGIKYIPSRKLKDFFIYYLYFKENVIINLNIQLGEAQNDPGVREKMEELQSDWTEFSRSLVGWKTRIESDLRKSKEYENVIQRAETVVLDLHKKKADNGSDEELAEVNLTLI